MGAGGGTAKRVGLDDDNEATAGYKMRPAAVAAVAAMPKKKTSAWSGIMPESSPSKTGCTASNDGGVVVDDNGEAAQASLQHRSDWDDEPPAEQAIASGGFSQSAPSGGVIGSAAWCQMQAEQSESAHSQRVDTPQQGALRGGSQSQAAAPGGVHLGGTRPGSQHGGFRGGQATAAPVTSGGLAAVTQDANKDLETLLLQTNWSAIYQLFHQRFGIAALEKVERGSVVKPAVEMTLSIVAKCFALLRSDPSGRLHCTPLHIAALQSSTEAAEVIVRDLPQLVAQTHQPSNSALCPLHIAILCGSQAIVELLLEGKANPNVRTLHDICPLHLASTTSKDLCHLLLAYTAEPEQRDVMGSTSLHYASVFKQQPVVEVLMGHDKAGRLACDMDQKKVSALHIACALYASEEDLLVPMTLIAHGAKPWQSDVHGASPRELVPWNPSSALQMFFETHGDKAQNAAQQWLDEEYLTRRIIEGDEHEQALQDGGGRSPSPSDRQQQVRQRLQPQQQSSSQQSQQEDSQQEQQQPQEQQGQMLTSSQSVKVLPEATGQIGELSAEAERLRKELAEANDKCIAIEKEKVELEHFRAKCGMLEESAADQQKVFDELQELYQNERNHNQQHFEALQQRHASQNTDNESRLNTQLEAGRAEALQESQKQLDGQQLTFNMKLQELQAQLDEAKATASAQEAAQAEQQAAAANFMNTSMRGEGLSKAELEEKVGELEAEVQRLAVLEEQSRSGVEAQRAQLLELKTAVRSACTKHSLGVAGDAAAELVAPLDAEVARLKGDAGAKEAEVKASSEQVSKLQEEALQLKAGKAEAEDKCARLALERQEAENRGSAATLKVETKLKEVELQHSQTLAKAKADAEDIQRRAEASEAQSQQLQPVVDKLRQRLAILETDFSEEQVLRKKYHNKIQDMKGAIRVFCRFRPMVAREAGESVALQRADAFTVECTRPVGDKFEVKPYPFDAVFDGDSTQEHVFADCKDLIQSAVDGYNVTIFAYGQTGAGKTHTMYGSEKQPGLAPRTIHALFDVVQREQQRGTKSFTVKAYMIEVYKQDIIDLLTDKPPPKDKKGLDVKKDIGRGIMYVDGVTELQFTSPEELKKALAEGEKRRHVAKTAMNSASSRSHLLLSIIIEGKVKETEQVIYGKITLCDLAGSERPSKSEVTGDALKEAIEINKSLSALGDVIEALTKGAKSVPYRNHKLTMLMQDSLGGSAKTLMFVNCSPAGSNVEETQISLKWASRARQVTNDVKKNTDSKEVARLKTVITMMSQAQHAEAPERPGTAAMNVPERPGTAGGADVSMHAAMNATFQRK